MAMPMYHGLYCLTRLDNDHIGMDIRYLPMCHSFIYAEDTHRHHLRISYGNYNSGIGTSDDQYLGKTLDFKLSDATLTIYQTSINQHLIISCSTSHGCSPPHYDSTIY